MIRTCGKCLIDYPATIEFFSKSKTGKYGLCGICKKCRSKYNKIWYELVGINHYNPEYHREWYIKNKENHLEDNKKRYNENKERHLERCKLWQIKNKEKHSKYVKTWKANNHDKVRAYLVNYRARRKNAEGNYVAEDIKLLLEKQAYKCGYCSIDISMNYHVDHKVPLSKGGSNWPINLIITCPSCNVIKGAKTEAEFRAMLVTKAS